MYSGKKKKKKYGNMVLNVHCLVILLIVILYFPQVVIGFTNFGVQVMLLQAS